MKSCFNNLSKEEQEYAIQIMRDKGASTNIVGCFGKWIVNDNGDLVNIEQECSHYFLYREDIERWDKDDMYHHISQKTWFRSRQPLMGMQFREAVYLAQSIIDKAGTK